MRRLIRAAAYLPSSVREGVRVAAADEDLFTLLATALERLDPAVGSSGPPTSIDLVAELPVAYDAAIEAAWGAPVSIRRTEPGPEGLARAVSAAESGTGGDVVVIAAQGPRIDASGSSSPPAVSAGAVAFRFTEGPGPRLSERWRSAPSSRSMLDLALELPRDASDGAKVDWTGDWTADRSTDSRTEPGPGTQYRAPPLSAVSEGAYIPRARYRESLPSRWRFRADRCPRCSAVTFPARGTCRSCGNREGLEPFALPRDNLEVVATTVIGPGGQPTEFDAQVESLGPYEVVLAELAPGVRVTLQLTDAAPGTVRIGDRVDTRLRRLYAMEGEWRYGRKAVPHRRG